MFLKTEYGSGYHLTTTTTSGNRTPALKGQEAETTSSSGSSDAVLAFLQQHIPDARLVEEMGRDVKYMLPNVHTHNFPALFQELDDNMQELGVMGYGVSDTTLEEVRIFFRRRGGGEC